jgi:hypothetical protein
MPWLMAGCLVPDPEKFPEAKSTAPVLNVAQATPLITQIVKPAPPLLQQTFRVGYRSEDAPGDWPVAYLYRDFRTPQQDVIGSDTIDDPVGKEFRIQVSFSNTPCLDVLPANTACCRQLTLLATHSSKLVRNDAGIEEVDPIVSGDDLAMMVWFVAIPKDSENPTNLGPCPAPLPQGDL